MPIYEYLCEDCAYTFEVKQSMKDEAIAVCARCGKSVRRIISAPAIMFKGSGWYVTDYSDKLKPPSSESTTTPAAPNKEGAAAPASTPAPASSPVPAAAPAASGSGSASTAPSTSSTPSGGTSNTT